jgi:2,4-dienoyl-CoA reductase-like NADH-dependent reductase (Old Yellow Enzyme family)
MLITLFSSFESEKLCLPNRLVMAPMSRYLSPNNVPGENVAAYYQRRARSGVGLIISEGTFIPLASASGYQQVPNFYGEEALAGWKRVIDAVHQEGGKMFPQLWHVGSYRDAALGSPAWSPSGVANPNLEHQPPLHVMTSTDIEALIEAYACAAASAQTLGFDGLEIHAAHGYLIDEFFWSETNHRTDQWGGDWDNRTRLACEIVKAVRQRVGEHFPIAMRISQWKQQDYQAKMAHSPAELEQWLRPLVDAGVDIFHASTRRFWQPEFADLAGLSEHEQGLNFAGWVKRITGKITISVGSVGLDSSSFEAAGVASVLPVEERLKHAEFDLIAVGRAVLADPQWPAKIQSGAYDRIIPFDKKQLATLDGV